MTARANRFEDPDRELYWNPALPSMPGQPPPAPMATPYAQPAAVPPAAPPAVTPKPDLALDVQPPKLDAKQVGQSMWEAPAKMPTQEAPPPQPQKSGGYTPDGLDFLTGLAGGWLGQYGPTQREQRWNREQQLALQDRARTDAAAQRASEAQARFGNWFAQNALREKQAEQADARIKVAQQNADTSQARFKEWQGQNAVLNDPNHPQHGALLQALEAQGVDTSPWQGLSLGTLKMQQQPINQAIERANAPQDIAIDAKRAGAMSAASVGAGEKIRNEYDKLREDRGEARAGRQAERDVDKQSAERFPQEAASFAKDADKDLQILSVANDFVTRNKGKKDIAGVGVLAGRTPDLASNEEALRNRADLRMIGEQWARGQSGAAISMSEEERFAIQSGTKETASEAQIKVAMGTLERVIKRSVQARAVGIEDAAGEVAKRYGVDLNLGNRTRRATSKPRRSVGTNFGAAPAASAPAGARVVGEDW